MKTTSKLCLAIAIIFSLVFSSSCKKGESCASVSGLTNRTVSSSSEMVKWTSTGATGYTVQYRVAGSSSWLMVSSIADSTTLTGLSYNSTYEWQVKSICASGASGFSSSGTFATGCPPGYEGANCSVRVNAKFAGRYAVRDTESYMGTINVYNYYTTIIASVSDPSALAIMNFGGFDSTTSVSATVNGNSFTVPTCAVNNQGSPITITNASGSVNGNLIDYRYTASDNTGTATDHVVGAR